MGNKILVYRQGDITLMPVNDISLDAAEEVKSPMKGHTVLAWGEVTGHFHSIISRDAKQFRLGDKEYVQVHRSTHLRHQEHSPTELPAGVYQKIIAREYESPGKTRQVVD